MGIGQYSNPDGDPEPADTLAELNSNNFSEMSFAEIITSTERHRTVSAYKNHDVEYWQLQKFILNGFLDNHSQLSKSCTVDDTGRFKSTSP